MKTTSKRLSILSNLEEFAFYGLPDFNDEQRYIYFAFEEQEWKLILKCPSPHSQVYCAIQMGYFKAKKMFFRFSLNKIPHADLHFVLSHTFPDTVLSEFTVTKHEYYLQREEICHLFDYKPWSNEFLPQLIDRANLSTKRDISPSFIAHELLDFLQNKKIVRPGYTTLQKIISHTLTQERLRLKLCLKNHLTDFHKKNLNQLIQNEKTLSELAALKKDAKNFGSSMMRLERNKHNILKPLYNLAKLILPQLDISQQNVAHYASLTHHYTIYDLKRFDNEQRYLYLLCYAFKRYQKITGNLVDAFDFNVKKLEKEIKQKVGSHLAEDKEKADKQVGRLILMYVDQDIRDSITFGEARKQAFEILSKESIRSIGEKMLKKSHKSLDLQWKEREKRASRYKYHLRPLFMKIDFQSQLPESPLLQSILWMKNVFKNQKSLSKQKFDAFPRDFISKRLEPYLLTIDENHKSFFNADRYEIFVYCQILKQMETGAIHINDSPHHKPFASELVFSTEKEKILDTLNIPWSKTSFEKHLDSLLTKLETLWIAFNNNLSKGQLAHLKYDFSKKELIWVKSKLVKEVKSYQKHSLYENIPISDISDVLRFVNDKTEFLSAFNPLQPLYKKHKLDEDHLIAVLISQATGLGHYKMAQTSDIPYHTLEATYQQYMRLATLEKAHDIIANSITRLRIFPHYAFDLDILYGGVDGQKYEAITPTAKARYSRKYFKKGRGIVAYTLLSNHVPIQSKLIGAHEHESYFVFDIWYGNTSLINPTVITGDMHSVNKANFALLHWFGGELRPRFTNLIKEIGKVSGTTDIFHYQKFLVQPAGQINKNLILGEKENIERVIATLGLKEMSQSSLIRKLCSLSPHNNTRKAIFEYNKLLRDIYTLECALNPKMLSDAHRSQNRLESYHTLRAAIAKAGGRKALLGHTDLEIEISNLCGRLIAGAIIYYNAAIQSRLIEKDPTNKKQLKEVKKSSPISWAHIHFTGHFAFYNNKKRIDIDKLIEYVDI